MSEPPVPEKSALSREVDRSVGVARLSAGVEKLSREVGGLRRELDARPTSEVVTYRRRRTAAALALIGACAVWGTDAHVENCSPGTEANKILAFATDRALKTPNAKPLDATEIRALVQSTQPTAACDISFPLHHHGSLAPARSYRLPGLNLSGWNLIGLAGYGLLGGILWVWQRPRRRIDRKEPS